MRANAYFGGAGGSSRGLHDAGFDVIGFDVWPIAVETHQKNGLPACVCDLSTATDLPDCDLAWFSTPCQPFSAAGDGEGEFDDRDGFPWALRILAETLPPVAIFENVKGLTFGKHRAYLAGIIASIRALGYDLDHRVLNTADYGVPQTRERFIMIARRDGAPITWPTVTHTEHEGMFTAKWVSMAEALGWGIDAGWRYNRGAGMVENHGDRRPHPFSEPSPTVTGNTYKDMKVVALDRRTNSTYADGVGPSAFVAVTRPSPAVVTSNGQCWVHDRPATSVNGDVRISAPGRHDPEVSGSQQADAIRVSIDELATLQGFPAGWKWCGNKTEQARQIGNAVPPKLAELLARSNTPLESSIHPLKRAVS